MPLPQDIANDTDGETALKWLVENKTPLTDIQKKILRDIFEAHDTTGSMSFWANAFELLDNVEDIAKSRLKNFEALDLLSYWKIYDDALERLIDLKGWAAEGYYQNADETADRSDDDYLDADYEIASGNLGRRLRNLKNKNLIHLSDKIQRDILENTVLQLTGTDNMNSRIALLSDLGLKMSNAIIATYKDFVRAL